MYVYLCTENFVSDVSPHSNYVYPIWHFNHKKAASFHLPQLSVHHLNEDSEIFSIFFVWGYYNEGNFINEPSLLSNTNGTRAAAKMSL